MTYPSGRAAKTAGTVFFIGLVEVALGIFLAEFLYPGYSVSLQPLSDLGTTCNSGTCQVFQPSSTIFNISLGFAGILVIVTAIYLRRSVKADLLVGFLLISGAAMIGVGVFPETFGLIHGIVSGITFLSISVSAIVAYKVERAPLSYFSVVLGVISLVSAVLYESRIYLGLGQGGMERIIVYPVLLWALAFSGQLLTEGQAL